MQNPKRAIRIVNPTGGSWTSVKNATKWVRQGRAHYLDEQTIEMNEGDYRHLASGRIEPAQVLIPQLPLGPFEYLYDGPANLRTFARYPDALAFVY